MWVDLSFAGYPLFYISGYFLHSPLFYKFIYREYSDESAVYSSDCRWFHSAEYLSGKEGAIRCEDRA